MSIAMTKPAIAYIASPTSHDFRRAVVTQTYFAREMLWMAESCSDKERPRSRSGLLHARTALHTLRAASAILSETDGDDDVARMSTLLDRAIHACEAAIGHIERYQSYEADQVTKLDQDMLRKQLPIWRRSAEEAKKDTHRALTLMCERWPDAYEKEMLEDA